MPFIIFLCVWVAINTWVTVKVLRSPAGIDRRRAIALAPWVIPFVGALVAYMTVRSHERAAEMYEPSVTRYAVPPPKMLSAPASDPLFLAEHITAPNGFPMLSWPAIETWVAQIADPEASRLARIQSQRAWLEHLRAVLGPHYLLHESEDAFVLSSLEDNVAEATGNYISATRRKISRLLGGLAQFATDRKSVLLVLDDEETYYNYVSIFYPEDGEFAFSGGMFIHNGCPHFVVPSADVASIEPVIAHELTHSAVSHLCLPVWLDEGIAVNTELRIVGSNIRLRHPRELHNQHIRFWNSQNIQEFWSGHSFSRADDACRLSYDLARILVEHASRPWESFEAFVVDAVREDAGAESASTHLRVDLGAMVCVLLEREPADDWSPKTQPSVG